MDSNTSIYNPSSSLSSGGLNMPVGHNFSNNEVVLTQDAMDQKRSNDGSYGVSIITKTILGVFIGGGFIAGGAALSNAMVKASSGLARAFGVPGAVALLLAGAVIIIATAINGKKNIKEYKERVALTDTLASKTNNLIQVAARETEQSSDHIYQTQSALTKATYDIMARELLHKAEAAENVAAIAQIQARQNLIQKVHDYKNNRRGVTEQDIKDAQKVNNVVSPRDLMYSLEQLNNNNRIGFF